MTFDEFNDVLDYDETFDRRAQLIRVLDIALAHSRQIFLDEASARAASFADWAIAAVQREFDGPAS